MSDSRRTTLKKLGGLGALVLFGCHDKSAADSACPTATNVTRGPFFVDTIDDPNIKAGGGGPPPGGPHDPHGPRGPHDMHRPPPGFDHGPPPGGPGGPMGKKMIDPAIPERADLRADTKGTTGISPGVPLTIALSITDAGAAACAPIANARVDIWHCNAAGIYSDVREGMNDRGADHTGENDLRGYQHTDARGQVTFTTTYPGWYEGRCVHIHFKVRVIDAAGTITTETTSQLFLADATSDAVFAAHPAYANKAERMRNADDDIFDQEDPTLILDATGSLAAGYTAAITVGVKLGTIDAG